MSDLNGRLAFIQEAERLKNVLRSAHTSQGRRESTAEHTWRLCLMALVFADRLEPVNLERVLKLCVVHDLGEAIHGDVPAVALHLAAGKSDQERADLEVLTATLPEGVRSELLALWEEYEAGLTPEAKAVKALDKLETIIQHNQGDNPEDFDYAFNLDYGRRYTAADPLFAEIRALVDADTRRRAEASGQLPA